MTQDIMGDRRRTLQWILAASTLAPLSATERVRAAQAPALPPSAALGYGTDPDLLRAVRPGQLWPLTLSPPQKRCAAALCDVIIPADEVSPSASAVGVVDFIDEWVSAPYPQQQADRVLILGGLGWLDAEATRRARAVFAELGASLQAGICRDICYLPDAAPPYTEAARFFARYRDLTAGGFYTTPAGRADIGYVGNLPTERFEGPPPELLAKLGLG